MKLKLYNFLKNFSHKELREKELLDICNVEYVKTRRKVTSIKFYKFSI